MITEFAMRVFLLYIVTVLFLQVIRGQDVGCTIDSKTFAIGESYILQAECYNSTCLGNDNWSDQPCPTISEVPLGWTLAVVKNDLTKPYPDCCPTLEPLFRDIWDTKNYPKTNVPIEISYKDQYWVQYGNDLSPLDTVTAPDVNYAADPTSWYTLIMVDIDYNNPGKQTLLWLVGNIPGNNVSTGEVLTSYTMPVAQRGTDFHRYVFFVLEQPRKLDFDEEELSNSNYGTRREFSITDFTLKYSLNDVIGFNFFRASWDAVLPPCCKKP
uniref:Single domain-containing protein n=1 Tax=Homalodisca liturata TaxID=320908 RepID=A0A1B6JHW8_9HEMI